MGIPLSTSLAQVLEDLAVWKVLQDHWMKDYVGEPSILKAIGLGGIKLARCLLLESQKRAFMPFLRVPQKFGLFMMTR